MWKKSSLKHIFQCLYSFPFSCLTMIHFWILVMFLFPDLLLILNSFSFTWPWIFSNCPILRKYHFYKMIFPPTLKFLDIVQIDYFHHFFSSNVFLIAEKLLQHLHRLLYQFLLCKKTLLIFLTVLLPTA